MPALRHAARPLIAVAMIAAALIAIPAVGGADSPSDDRADFFDSANATTCAQVGFPGATIAFADDDAAIDDGNVSGSVSDGKFVNVDEPAPGVTILAVVVKGGNGYNVYSQSSGNPAGNHVPPALPSPQRYISPLNDGGNVPDVSHWFICYEGGAPPTASILVRKAVTNAGDGITTPTTYSASVTCDDGTAETLTLPGTGGPAVEGLVTGIEAGSICIVSEDAGSLPPGTVVSYDPAEAATTGVVADGGSVTITVTNDYSDVLSAAAVAAMPTFTG